MDRETFVSRIVKDKHNSYMEYSLNEKLSNVYFFDIYTFAEVKNYMIEMRILDIAIIFIILLMCLTARMNLR